SRWTWPWAIGATLVLLASLLWQQRLPHPADLTRVHRYARGLRGIALMTGMCWGVMGVLFIDVDQPYAITIVLVMVAGMSSGAVAVYASCWPLALLYCAANIIPVGLTLLMSGQAAAMMLGVAGLLYFYAMAVFAYHVAQSVTRAIELGFENEGLVERLRDQTQRALEARELAEGALADAEKANRAHTVFLASASHALRQPLHAMGLSLSALARADLNPPQQRLLAQAQAAAQATGDMLATLMDFS